MFYRLRRIRKVFQIRFHTEFLYEHPLRELPSMECPAGLQMRTLKSDEAHLLQKVWNVNEAQIKVRFERGDVCYAGFMDDTICSYHWVQYSGLHFFQQANKQIEVKPDEGWIYHVRVSDWARGRGINSFVYATILADASRMGKSKLFIYTGAKNTANQKGLLKCGFTKVKEFFSVSYGKHYFLIRERALN